MSAIELKLKQASAVLGVAPKDLQNLVQLKILRPRRQDSVYLFDKDLLLQAKLAFYLKESLGTSSELLARFTEALSRDLRGGGEPSKVRYVWLRSRPAGGQEAIEVRIPLQGLARELEEQLPLASMHKDLPRGRKRPGWKREFLQSLKTAAGDLSGVTEAEIIRAVRRHRAKGKRPPEISVGRPTKRA
jgi:hypothetical protein